MIHRHATFVLLVTILAATTVLAGTITTEIDGSAATTVLDFGVPLGRIISIRVTGELQMVPIQTYCTLVGHNSPVCGHSHDNSRDLWTGLSVTSGGAETSTWMFDSGTFDRTMSLAADDQDLMFADGTGTFGIEILADPYAEPCDNGSALCSYQVTPIDPGSVAFTLPLTLTIEFEDVVPTERWTWGAAKSIYR